MTEKCDKLTCDICVYWQSVLAYPYADGAAMSTLKGPLYVKRCTLPMHQGGCK